MASEGAAPAHDPAVAGSGPRQRIVRVRGSRRAQLTPAPNTHAEPDERDREAGAGVAGTSSGPNDAALRREVPPHY